MALFAAFALTSCDSLFDNDEETGDEDYLKPAIEIPYNIIAGSTIALPGYIDSKYQDAGFEFRFGNVVIPSKSLDASTTELSIPKDLKGTYKVTFVSGGHTFGLNQTTVYELLSTVMPGLAFKADLSNANTIFCIRNENRDHQDPEVPRESCTTQKFDQGVAPSEVKFTNVKGVQVPATFTSIKDISSDFFYATLLNASSKDDVYFNQNDFTCKVIMDPDRLTAISVVVEKKSGIITALTASGDAYKLLHGELSFQSIGARRFCFTNSGYYSDFTTNKLYQFEIDEYPDNMWKPDQPDMPDFQFNTEIKLIPGQENIDIISERHAHWLALGDGKILFNKERMLSGGSLTSAYIPQDYYTRIFGCYASAQFYYLDSFFEANKWNRAIMIATGGRQHTEPSCDCQYDIYQFSDSTYLRARAETIGKTIHNYSFVRNATTGYKFNRYEEEVAQVEQYWDIIEDAFPRYPCKSRYEYYIPDGSTELFRSKIAERHTGKSVLKPIANYEFRSISASENAVSLICWDISTLQNSYVVEIDAGGNKVQQIDIPQGMLAFDICRLHD